MSHKVKLRLYDKERDEEATLELWRRAWKVAYPTIDFDVRMKWFRPYWRTLSIVKKAVITLAVMNREIVGFFTIEASGYLDQFAVAPELQGKGVSTMLMNEAKRLSPDSIDLDVNFSNTRAVRFYEKNGFVIGKLKASPSGGLVREMHWQK